MVIYNKKMVSIHLCLLKSSVGIVKPKSWYVLYGVAYQVRFLISFVRILV